MVKSCRFQWMDTGYHCRSSCTRFCIVKNRETYLCTIEYCECRLCDLITIFFFFKQKTAYEIKLVTGVQTCALPISEAESNLTIASHQGIAAARFAPSGRCGGR